MLAARAILTSLAMMNFLTLNISMPGWTPLDACIFVECSDLRRNSSGSLEASTTLSVGAGTTTPGPRTSEHRLAAGSAPAQRLSGSAFAVWHLQWFERLQVPAYATGRFRKTEMISARELLDRAQADIGPLFDRPFVGPGLLLQAAGKENTRYTPHCAWLLGDDVPIGGSALFSIAGADLQPC